MVGYIGKVVIQKFIQMIKDKVGVFKYDIVKFQRCYMFVYFYREQFF